MGRREAPVEGGEFMHPFFPQRGWTQVSLGVGAPALCHRHGEGRLPGPSALHLGCTF